MSDENQQAREILGTINERFQEIVDLIREIMEEHERTGNCNPDKMKLIHDKISEIEDLKEKILKLYKMKGLYDALAQLDLDIASANGMAGLLWAPEKKLWKKVYRDFLKRKLEELEKNKLKLKKALKKQLGEGPWLEPLNYINKVIKNIFDSGYLDDPESAPGSIINLLKPLHDLKIHAVVALPYRIGLEPFSWWYERLKKMNERLAECKDRSSIPGESNLELRYLEKVISAIIELEPLKKEMEGAIPLE